MQLSEDTKAKLNNPLIVIYLLLAVIPFVSSNLGISNANAVIPIFFIAMGVLCAYFANRRKELYKNLVPIILTLIVPYFYYNSSSPGFQYWPVAFGFAIFASSLWSTRLLDVEVAFLIGIFLVSTYIHVVPGLITDYIEEIDPYYDYKWGAAITDTHQIPVHDWWTYPKKGGLDRSLMPFGASVSMAFFGELLTFVGMTFHQSAILISTVAAGLSVIAIYFLIKELLFNRENAKYAAMFGAFILMLSIGWSTKAHATDCENDAWGGLMLLSLFFIYMWGINRNKMWFTILAGGAFYGWFVTAWDGYKIFAMVISIAVAIVSFTGIFKGKRTLDYLKYYAGMILVGNIVWRLILHTPDQIFSTLRPSGIELASYALIIFAVGLNEAMLRYKDRVSKHQILAIIGALVIGLVIFGPTVWYNFYKVGFVDIGQPSVVFKTIAEQQPFADSIGNYLSGLSKVFGLASLVALLCIPCMLYIGIKEDNFGSIVMFSWLCPFAWGFYFKSQYIFLASIPFAVAGAWFVQYIITSKKDHDGLRIIPTLVVLFCIFVYTPLSSTLFSYDTTSIFFNVATYDRMGWESTLQYFLKDTPVNTAVITWWDYGHWLTAVSHKFVLIDNLQNDHWEIQDVAKFFMKETNEDKAFKIVQDYQNIYSKGPYLSGFGGVKLDYAVIDWTMIGKSGAMHFIATGNLTTQADGDYNAYSVCQFAPQYSNINGSLVTNDNGGFEQEKMLTYVCTYNKDGLGGVQFRVRSDRVFVEAIDQNGARIPWATWIASKDASLMGVKSPTDIMGVSMQYYDRINNVPPTYTNFVYASGDFKNYMLARLYFGENIQSYKDMGLANVNWTKLKHFTLDKSFEEGFVETWKINYNVTEVKQNVTG